jgi:hypothetical protein
VKSLSFSLLLVVCIGALAAAVVWAFNFDSHLEFPALIGCVMGTLFGLTALTFKARTPIENGAAGVRNLLFVQGVTLGLRLFALLIGAFAMQRRGFEPFAYVLSFFACYLLQQIVETRFVLQRSDAKSGLK